MMRTVLGALALLMLMALAPQAMAASFDCTKASTPFEHAICDNPTLSSADDLLAKAFATATGGLTKPAANQMRADQRAWLDFAQSACTDDAKPLASGKYDEEQVGCLVTEFSDRSTALEDSRMLGGHRFYLASSYSAVPDPDAAADPDYYWRVATSVVTLPLMDEDDPLAADFNAFMRQTGDLQSGAESSDGPDAQSDSDLTIRVKQITSTRITMSLDSYWFGHGAAHGNWGTSYVHYLPLEKREMVGTDMFSGAGWEKKMLDLAISQLNSEHADNLMLDDPKSLADVVTQPGRWSFDNEYGLVIQFEPYEVAPYAYGAPTITIPWDALAEIKSATADNFLY